MGGLSGHSKLGEIFLKIVYMFDDAGYFLGGKKVTDDYQLQSGETEIKPTTELYNPVWNGAAWTGMTQSDWQAKQEQDDKALFEQIPLSSNQPSATETQLAALAYQQMTTQQTITDLQAQNAQMAYNLMTQGGATA